MPSPRTAADQSRSSHVDRAERVIAPTEALFSTAGSFERLMEHLPAAFAVTNGMQHTLVYANEAFRKLLTLDGDMRMGVPIESVFAEHERVEMLALLDRAFRSGLVSRNRTIEPEHENDFLLRCTVWPDVTASGKTDNLLIELRHATQDEQRLGLHRRVAERLLLSAMREEEAATVAHASQLVAQFLEAEGGRLAASLDEDETLEAMSHMSLPHFGAWCFVDVLEADNTARRHSIVHPVPAMQALLDSLGERWVPTVNDDFGIFAVLRADAKSTVIASEDFVLDESSLDPTVLKTLQAIGVGAMLTVPLHVGGAIAGAITFVGEGDRHRATTEEVSLAHELANRAEMAIERARLHGQAIAAMDRAESANRAKSEFLGMMSHELRTPLNAIGGYVDLIAMELRGPVTVAQRKDLDRIRVSQRYLLGLINDLLNLTKIGNENVGYEITNLDACEVLQASVTMLEPLFAQKGLIFDGVFCSNTINVRGDRERVIQILVNLLSNSMKFTTANGHIRVDGEESRDRVMFRVTDTGIGMAAEKLDSIFDPFVQLSDTLTGKYAGMGLGLAISRDLARAMGGDLTVRSAPGEGSTFTLTLPRTSVTQLPGRDASERRQNWSNERGPDGESLSL
jgi:signal transduction histidine kinase